MQAVFDTLFKSSPSSPQFPEYKLAASHGSLDMDFVPSFGVSALTLHLN